MLLLGTMKTLEKRGVSRCPRPDNVYVRHVLNKKASRAKCFSVEERERGSASASKRKEKAASFWIGKISLDFNKWCQHFSLDNHSLMAK